MAGMRHAEKGPYYEFSAAITSLPQPGGEISGESVPLQKTVGQKFLNRAI